jgi:O-antigen/teichoic acid export membrane protein
VIILKGLRQKTIGGLLWSLSEKVGFAIIQFVVITILARLLDPSDFGMIASLSFFIALSNALVESGFSQALIYKQKPTHEDYSTVFFINIFMGLFLYGTLYFSAPLIAEFFRQPMLTDLTRVLCLIFVINSFSRIQNVILVKQMSFKKLLFIRIPSFLIGGAVGIFMAYNNMGVWSLVYQQVTTQVINTIQLTLQGSWRPSFIFSVKSFKELYSYGRNLVASSVSNVFYSNLDSILIGRFASMTDVGFFQRAKSTKQLPINTLAYSLNSVTFSALSSIGEDNERLKRAYKDLISQVFFLLSPVLIGMAILGNSIFAILFTDKWLPAVPYFQWLCIAGIFQVINSYNLNILKVKGRTDLFLRNNIVKRVIQSVLMFVALQESIYALVIMMLVTEFMAYLMNSYICGKFIQYPMLEQLVDLMPIALLNFVFFIVMFGLTFIIKNDSVLFLVGSIFFGTTLYLSLAFLLKMQVFTSMKNQVISLMKISERV